MIKTVDEYMSELEKGNRIRIRYNEKIDDCLGGYWSEELWQSVKNDDYFCYYPVSSYDSDFHTTCSKEEARVFIKNAIRDLVGNENGEQTVVSISVEQCENIKTTDIVKTTNLQVTTNDKLEEKYIAKMNQLKNKADQIVYSFLKESGYVNIAESYRKFIE